MTVNQPELQAEFEVAGIAHGDSTWEKTGVR
jgi:hypothetical protein